MEVFSGLHDDRPFFERSALTIGNFDGFHRGHREIVRVAAERARAMGAPAVALTFEPHPIAILRPEMAPERLTPSEQKLALLEEAGLDIVVVADSTPEFLNLSPEAFLRDVIVARFHPLHIVEGSNFGFGKGRKGDIDTLRHYAGEFGYQVHIVEPVQQRLPHGAVERVSSSLIRKLLLAGETTLAAAALGRDYALRGRVIEGAGRGRVLGFPTANLEVEDQLVPADGVYTAWAEVGRERYRSAVSIGSTPTFGGTERQVEAFLLDFDRDLYHRQVVAHFRRRLRGQRKFASKEELMAQIENDVQEARQEPH